MQDIVVYFFLHRSTGRWIFNQTPESLTAIPLARGDGVSELETGF